MYRSRQFVARFVRDKRGVAAVEFAFIVPLMLVLLFGMIDTSSAVAVDRKVTIAARTISDLVSQATQVKDADLENYFALAVIQASLWAVHNTAFLSNCW